VRINLPEGPRRPPPGVRVGVERLDQLGREAGGGAPVAVQAEEEPLPIVLVRDQVLP
jgi:hypothetical protein